MVTLTADLAKRLKRLPGDLQEEFPEIPFDAIERSVDADAQELVARARFNDFVPVLVHKAVREQLRSHEDALHRGRLRVLPAKEDRE